LKNNRLCKTDRRWISSTNQQPSRESLRRCMKVRTNRLDKPNRTTSERQRRIAPRRRCDRSRWFAPFIAGRWLAAAWRFKDGHLRTRCAAINRRAHRDLSHARLFNAAISKWNSAQLAWISHSRLPHGGDLYCDRGLASDCFVARGNAKQLPVLASAEHASRLLRASGESEFVRDTAMDYGSFAFSRADRLPNASRSVPRWRWVSFNRGDP